MHRIKRELQSFSKPSLKETFLQAGSVLIISAITSGIIALLDFGVVSIVGLIL